MTRYAVIAISHEGSDERPIQTGQLLAGTVICEVEAIDHVFPCDICGIEFVPATNERSRNDADTWRRKF